MFVTLDVSKVIGWLKAPAPCSRAHGSGGSCVGREAGGGERLGGAGSVRGGEGAMADLVGGRARGERGAPRTSRSCP